MGIAEELLSIMDGAMAQPDDAKGWLSSGHAPLNVMLTGDHNRGFGYGLMYEIYGPSQSGKTIIATNVMIECQKAGGIAILIDFERSFKPSLGANLGLKTTKPHLLHLYPRTWEEGMTKGMQLAMYIREKGLIKPEAPILMITDSIAAAVPKSSMEKDLTELNMNDTTALARATSMTLKVIAARSPDIGLTSIFLNQIRTSPGVMFGDPTTTPGGKSMEFYATARVVIGRKLVKKDKEVTGQTMTFKTVKNRITRPFKTSELDLVWDEEGVPSFNFVGSLIEYLGDKGLLEKSGNMYVWDGKKRHKSALCEIIVAEGSQDKLTALLEEKAAAA